MASSVPEELDEALNNLTVDETPDRDHIIENEGEDDKPGEGSVRSHSTSTDDEMMNPDDDSPVPVDDDKVADMIDTIPEPVHNPSASRRSRLNLTLAPALSPNRQPRVSSPGRSRSATHERLVLAPVEEADIEQDTNETEEHYILRRRLTGLVTGASTEVSTDASEAVGLARLLADRYFYGTTYPVATEEILDHLIASIPELATA